MYKRRYPCVIRYHYVSKEKDSEMYYHRLLLLYCPWRSEEELKLNDSYQLKYSQTRLQILNVVKKFEPYYEEVEDVLETFDPNDCAPEIWNQIAAEVEHDAHCEGNIAPDPNYAFLNPEHLPVDIEKASQPKTPRTSFTIGLANMYLSDDSFLRLIRSLNCEQRRIFDFIYDWCIKTRLTIEKCSCTFLHLLEWWCRCGKKSHNKCYISR